MGQSIMRQAICGVGASLAVATLLALSSVSSAELVRFKADLKGSNEVPSTQSAGIGTVTATYDSATRALLWNGSYSGLTGPATAAHIHGPAAMGANARLVVWISDNIGQCDQGRCTSKSDAKTAPLTSPFQGSATLTDVQASELMAGMYYVNIHTDASSAGEIRGQLVKVP